METRKSTSVKRVSFLLLMFPIIHSFGATAFCSYGAFWLSFAWTISGWSGVVDGYTGTPAGEFDKALGFYLFGWFIFTLIMFVASWRSSVALTSVFFFLTSKSNSRNGFSIIAKISSSFVRHSHFPPPRCELLRFRPRRRKSRWWLWTRYRLRTLFFRLFRLT